MGEGLGENSSLAEYLHPFCTHMLTLNLSTYSTCIQSILFSKYCKSTCMYLVNYNPSLDAPFEAKYVLKALEPFSPSSPAYKMLKITEQVEFEDYLRDHPNAFSWKTVAEVLYKCGDEKRLDSLFTYMKSPEGKEPFECPTSLILYGSH